MSQKRYQFLSPEQVEILYDKLNFKPFPDASVDILEVDRIKINGLVNLKELRILVTMLEYLQIDRLMEKEKE